MSLTPEQHEMRRSGVGASEAASACGLGYQQTVELWLLKTGQAEPDDLSRNRDVLFGQHMEAGGIAYWSALRETPVTYPMPTVRHPEHSFIFATPDAQISERRGLQFKTMDFWRFKLLQELGVAEVIPEVVLQVQQEMLVMDWDSDVITILVGKDLHDIEVERNERLQSLIVERESLFWDHVQRRVPPPVDFSRDGALRCVQALHPKIKTGDVVRLSEEAAAFWEAYEKAGRTARELLDKKRPAWKASVLGEIGDHYGGLLPDGRLVRRKTIEKKAYTVAATEYLDVRAVKYDGENIIEEQFDEPDDPDADDYTAALSSAANQ